MAKGNGYTHRCRCCGDPFDSVREDAATCSDKCRQRCSRADRAGFKFAWGELARFMVDRRPPGLGLKTLAKKRRDEARKRP